MQFGSSTDFVDVVSVGDAGLVEFSARIKKFPKCGDFVENGDWGTGLFGDGFDGMAMPDLFPHEAGVMTGLPGGAVTGQLGEDGNFNCGGADGGTGNSGIMKGNRNCNAASVSEGDAGDGNGETTGVVDPDACVVCVNWLRGR
jgi:hypothetical protein